MKALVQRVSSATVNVNQKIVGSIGKGIVILLGITHDDNEAKARFIAEKVVNLRIFEDAQDKMNLSLKDIKGKALVISQFTLYGDCSHGRRPSFTEAAKPEIAIPLYEIFISQLKQHGVQVETGVFGAKMEVEIHNFGPVTVMVEK